MQVYKRNLSKTCKNNQEEENMITAKSHDSLKFKINK